MIRYYIDLLRWKLERVDKIITFRRGKDKEGSKRECLLHYSYKNSWYIVLCQGRRGQEFLDVVQKLYKVNLLLEYRKRYKIVENLKIFNSIVKDRFDRVEITSDLLSCMCSLLEYSKHITTLRDPKTVVIGNKGVYSVYIDKKLHDRLK